MMNDYLQISSERDSVRVRKSYVICFFGVLALSTIANVYVVSNMPSTPNVASTQEFSHTSLFQTVEELRKDVDQLKALRLVVDADNSEEGDSDDETWAEWVSRRIHELGDALTALTTVVNNLITQVNTLPTKQWVLDQITAAAGNTTETLEQYVDNSIANYNTTITSYIGDQVNYAINTSESYTNTQITNLNNTINAELTEYAKITYVDESITNLNNTIQGQITNIENTYATKVYVDNSITNLNNTIQEELTHYATQCWVNGQLDNLKNELEDEIEEVEQELDDKIDHVQAEVDALEQEIANLAGVEIGQVSVTGQTDSTAGTTCESSGSHDSSCTVTVTFETAFQANPEIAALNFIVAEGESNAVALPNGPQIPFLFNGCWPTGWSGLCPTGFVLHYACTYASNIGDIQYVAHGVQVS